MDWILSCPLYSNRTDQRHLERAIRAAELSTCRTRHATVIAHGPRVLAVAVNSDRNHPMICSDPKTEAAFHSEINALRQVKGFDPSKITVYNARIDRAGKPRMSKPCLRCARVLESLGVKRIIWTT